MNDIILQKELDKSVVEQLEMAGDKLYKERNIDYFFYFYSKKNRDDFIKAAIQYNLTFADYYDVDAEKKGKYGLILKRTKSIELEEIQQFTEKIISLTVEFNGIYDGWETMVMR